MISYCLFCATGYEKFIVNQINKQYNNTLIALFPVRIMSEKHNGVWIDVEKALMPGYIFLYSNYPIQIEPKIKNSYCLLSYSDGQTKLLGKDLEYAKWIFDYNGKLEQTNIYIEGNIYKIVNGPLADHIGKLIKIDKHKRKAILEIIFEQRTINISMPVCFVVKN